MTKETVLNDLLHWWPVLPVLGVLIALFIPWNFSDLSSHPHPAQSYQEAVQRIETLKSTETNLNPLCRAQFFTHGQKVDRTIIFVHGFTTCPQQFNALGQRFYDLGYNVLTVPVPHHGLLDRMTDDQANLTAQELTAYSDEVVDIAHGLGNRVVMAGISLGGVTTAWAAQNRSDVDLAVLISPAFGFKQIPTALTVPAANLFLILPVSFEWWNPDLKENGGPAYAYPRYATRSLGEISKLGFNVQAGARRSAPAAHSILVITNANEPAVNNELTAQVVRDWQAHGANLSTYQFGVELALGHDIIDPSDQNGNIAVVYPQLIALINQ